MGDTTTPIMGLVKPLVGASRSTWGNKWNGNADGIEAYCTNLFAEITALQQQIAALEAQMAGGAQVPIGGVIAWPNDTVLPPGYLWCDAAPWLIANYPLLFALLGTRYGGDGVTTFCTPDFRGCVLAGMDWNTGRIGGLIPDVPGAIGGEPLHTLDWNEMPPHTHNGYTDWEGNHAHNYWEFWVGYGSTNAWPDGFYWEPSGGYQATDVDGDHYHSLQIDTQGAGYAHNNLQVTALVSWIIRGA